MSSRFTRSHLTRSRFTARERFLLIGTIVLLAFMFLGGRLLPEVSAREDSSASLFQELKVFTDVIAIVQRDYVKPVDNKKLVEGAIKGMLTTLDPHSGYLDPDFYQDLQVQTKGEFGGLGLEITIKDGLLLVVSPMEGSPAELAGIKAGDSIIKIDGKYTKEFSLVDAVKKLRGPVGSPINLSIYRKGSTKLIDVSVVRDNIMVKSVRSRYMGDSYGYVRINQFMEKTADDLQAAIKSLANSSDQKQLKGLILDMRNNPGGLLTQAVRVCDMFLKSGIIVYTDGRVESQKQKFFAHSRGTEPDYPIVIIVNNGSASAAEIVAGALKDHGRALILGTQTFGKGSVQTISPLENGGALTLTTALYYTKSGNSIQLTGVKPDIELDSKIPEEKNTEISKEKEESAIQQYRESDLPGAINNPNGAEDKDHSDALRKINRTPKAPDPILNLNPEKEDLNVLLSKDNQLQKALELLKTFNVFKAPGTTTSAPAAAPQDKATAVEPSK